MKQMSEREIQDLLTPQARTEPPAGLAEAIKNEIPDELALTDAETPADGAPARFPISRSRSWLLAASVAFAVGGGFLTYRIWQQMPAESIPPVAVAESDPVQAAPEAAAAGGKVEATAADEVWASRARRLPASSGVTAADAQAAAGTAADAPDDPEPTRESVGDSSKDDGAVAFEAQVELPTEGLRHAENLRRRTAADRDGTADTETGAEGDAMMGAVADPAPDPYKVAETEARLKSIEAGEKKREGGRAEIEEQLIVVSETHVIDQAAQNRLSSAPQAPPPPPPPPMRPAPRTQKREGNQRIDEENHQIRDMRREAEQLESELRQLDEYGSGRRAPEPAPRHAAAPSTGGTAEPNDAPYGDVFFHDTGTNPFIDTEDDRLSTFGLDVDTGSYTVARRYLRDGNLPPREAVRVEELINYFDYGDAAPEREEFAIHAEGAPSIYGQGERYYLLRFNLSGRELQAAERRPAVLTFVVDVSGSMAQENRLGLVKQSLALLLDQLRRDDRIGLVIYGSHGQVLLEPTGDRYAIRSAIEQLRTGGSTNAEEGLTLAYEMAARHRRRDAINRVILCSDGVANVGHTSAGSILERIRREANQGIELTTVGFGMGNYNDTLMEQLADTGNGRYAYVDTLDEARRIFVENLTGTLQTLAAEARVQVEFDPEVVSRYRLLGYENRDIADKRFRDDTVDAGEIGAGHTVTALYELKLERRPRPSDEIAILRLRYGSIDQGKMVELERTVTGADFARRWENASPALKLTSLVAEFAEILNRSYWARDGDLDDVFRRGQRVSVQFEGDTEVAEFVSLAGRAARLWRSSQR